MGELMSQKEILLNVMVMARQILPVYFLENLQPVHFL
jgi:hypothetical protein